MSFAVVTGLTGTQEWGAPVNPACEGPCQNLALAILDASVVYLSIVSMYSEENPAAANAEERGSMSSFWRGAEDSGIQVQVVWV